MELLRIALKFMLKMSFGVTMRWFCAKPKTLCGAEHTQSTPQIPPSCFWALFNHCFLRMRNSRFPTYNFTFRWSPMDIFTHSTYIYLPSIFPRWNNVQHSFFIPSAEFQPSIPGCYTQWKIVLIISFWGLLLLSFCYTMESPCCFNITQCLSS